jgi:hypothetical protein
MAYLLISIAMLSMVLLFVFFRRSVREAREEYRMTATNRTDPDLGELGFSVVPGIFSRDDEAFVAEQVDQHLMVVFRRERKRLALRWVERRKLEARAIMSDHRRLASASADLRPSNEAILLLRYGRVRLLCECLSLAVWLVGPEGLRGLAEHANAVFHRVHGLNALAEQNGRKVAV